MLLIFTHDKIHHHDPTSSHVFLLHIGHYCSKVFGAMLEALFTTNNAKAYAPSQKCAIRHKRYIIVYDKKTAKGKIRQVFHPLYLLSSGKNKREKDLATGLRPPPDLLWVLKYTSSQNSRRAQTSLHRTPQNCPRKLRHTRQQQHCISSLWTSLESTPNANDCSRPPQHRFTKPVFTYP